MTPRTKPSQCVELRTAQESDLPDVLGLLDRTHMPTAGVAGTPSHFVVAESEGKVIGVVGLEMYGGSALLRSAVVEESWRGNYFPRFGFICVSRDSATPGVKSSIVFQEACPASATVMRKSLRG
jgi:amino-acid N-acetyltransferase